MQNTLLVPNDLIIMFAGHCTEAYPTQVDGTDETSAHYLIYLFLLSFKALGLSKSCYSIVVSLWPKRKDSSQYDVYLNCLSMITRSPINQLTYQANA